ncbi:hypothetical protein, partial [Providencia manganoxydans]|uniref:hypothetical protein n=1 Tax=Providencia manganoxydans TaxID=2923283 RepID=UPI0034E4B4A4
MKIRKRNFGLGNSKNEMKTMGFTPHFSLMVIYWLKMNILFFSQHIEISHWSFDSLSGLIQLEQ